MGGPVPDRSEDWRTLAGESAFGWQPAAHSALGVQSRV